MNKYDLKRKTLHDIDPDAKLKYKPVFLDAEETKQHFGYPFLLRNIKQRFVITIQLDYSKGSFLLSFISFSSKQKGIFLVRFHIYFHSFVRIQKVKSGILL